MHGVKEAYTAKELSLIFMIAVKNVLARAKRENWHSQPRQGRGGGKEWLFASMPEATQAAIRDALAAQLVKNLPALGQGRQYAEAAARQKGLRDLIVLPPSLRRRAEARAAIVGMFETWGIFLDCKGYAARAAFAAKYAANEIEVEGWIRETIPTFHYNSLANWQAVLQQKGVAALGGVYGKHRKGIGVIDSNPAMRELIIGMVAKFYDVSSIDIEDELQARFKGQPVPALRVIQRWVKAYKAQNGAALLKHQNPDEYKNKRMPAFGNASEGITRINQVWELDSSPTDIMLADGTRHTLLGCIDVATRRVVFHLAKTSSAAGVCALLRKALFTFGVPESIKTDNGADYKSQQVITAIHALGITQEFCTPFSPEQKPHIERVFRTFQHGIVKLLGGYIGHNVTDRKAIEGSKSFAERISKKKGLPKEQEYLLTPAEFQRVCDDWTQNLYGERKHSTLQISPNEAAARQSETVIRLQDERALDVLLMPVPRKNGIRPVGKKGIRVDNRRYYAPVLGGMVGEEVRVCFDDGNAGYLYVFNLDGEFVCRAEDPAFTGINLRELGIAAKRKEASLRDKAVKEARKAAKAIRPEELAREILAHKSAQAAEARQARPAETVRDTYTTPALQEAGKAARVGDTPTERTFTPDEMNYIEKLAERKAAATLEEAPPTQEELYAKLIRLEQRMAEGGTVTEQEARWVKSYKTTSYYRYFDRVRQAQGGRLPENIQHILAVNA